MGLKKPKKFKNLVFLSIKKWGKIFVEVKFEWELGVPKDIIRKKEKKETGPDLLLEAHKWRPKNTHHRKKPSQNSIFFNFEVLKYVHIWFPMSPKLIVCLRW
jgi:hypothetical protein